ncbi:hypothetical protein [Scytonema sp. NUACC26]
MPSETNCSLRPSMLFNQFWTLAPNPKPNSLLSQYSEAVGFWLDLHTLT